MVAKEADKETERGGLEAPPSKRASAASSAYTLPEGASVSAADGRPMAKAVLVGDSGVGKTSLMLRFSQDLYLPTSRATIGVDLQTREVKLPAGRTLNLQLWDTAGQEQFGAITASFFRNAHAVVLAYDVHSPASFASLQRWMVEVDRHAPAEVVKSIVGLKADAEVASTAVSEAEATAFAAKHGALSSRCSSLDGGTKVSGIFESLAEKLVARGFDVDGKRRQQGNVRLGKQQGGGKKKGCC